MIALLIATCSLAFILVYIIDGDNLPPVCALPLLGLTVFAFKEPVTRLLTGFNQKAVLNRKTGEKWQRIPGSETCYRPVAFMPDSVENPPQPKRPFSYPASSVALYDQKIYTAWQAGGTDYHADQIGYVMLATLLYLVSMGYLEIWFSPLYASMALIDALIRHDYEDYWVVLTDKGKSAQFTGKLEQKIKKKIQGHVNNFQNYRKWVPGAPLLVVLESFDTSGGDEENDDLETLRRKQRHSAMQRLLKDASKTDVVMRKQGRYFPNPDLEPRLQDEAEILAQLVQAYHEADPQFTPYLWRQIAGFLTSSVDEGMMRWLLRRESD